MACCVVGMAIAACGGGQIRNLPLSWRGVDFLPEPSVTVTRALASSPLMFGLRDARPDPSAVGVYEDSGFVVRTTDDVARYCSLQLGEMLVHAGARLNEPSTTVLDAELLDYRVVEGGTFNALVRVRTVLRRGEEEVWSNTYVGKSKRWGRTHNPENFNEALSNALAEVTTQLVQDDEFARALTAPPAAVPDPASAIPASAIPAAPPGS